MGTKEVYNPKNPMYLINSNSRACSASSSSDAGAGQSKAYGIKHNPGPKKEELRGHFDILEPNAKVLYGHCPTKDTGACTSGFA